MSFDAKTLKKLADACRKAGITKYKCADFEFELSPEVPESNYKKKKKNLQQPVEIADEIETDSLSQDALLMWSAVGPTDGR